MEGKAKTEIMSLLCAQWQHPAPLAVFAAQLSCLHLELADSQKEMDMCLEQKASLQEAGRCKMPSINCKNSQQSTKKACEAWTDFRRLRHERLFGLDVGEGPKAG